MSTLHSALLRQLVARGYLHQATDLEALDRLAAEGPITAYIGFDCTADSLHVGNLVGIMLLRRLQQTGHRPIALIGGGTSKIGDPSGKDESRKLLSEAQLAANIVGIRRSLAAFLDFGDEGGGGGGDGGGQAMLVNNAEWLDQLGYVAFLREYGGHFTINRMLTFDSVRLRLEREQPLTFLEFNYMIMQAYDFLELARRHDCRLQMGGSDQWGNIVNGVELGRRVEGRSLFGLTTPLITTAGGAKMGKTADGAVWLNDDRLPAFDYWQYWRNTADADVGRFLRLFTDLPLPEIEHLEQLEGAELNEAKKILADQAASLCRGESAAKAARQAAESIFETGAAGGDLPTVEVPEAELAAGIAILELLRRAGLAASNGEARRLIRGGGARLNEARISDESLQVGADQLIEGQLTLAAGKKRHVRIRTV
jgi:tyrosyl-tRNA synthetase